MTTDANLSRACGRFQFRLRHLLALPILLAVFFAALGREVPLLGLLAVVVVLIAREAVTSLYYRKSFSKLGCRLIVASFVLAVMICASLLCSDGPEAIHRAACTNNLKQIALALQNYHEAYGTFPPAYVADSQGRPIHSWRVLILPYLGARGLYERYHFDEPWNGPRNRLLAKEAPGVFRCLSDQGASPGRTNYVAVVGPHTVWPGLTARSLDQISDNPCDTLLLVEVANTSFSWLEPRDLTFEELPLAVGVPNGRGISSHHWKCAEGAFVDGSVRLLPNSISEETLRKLLLTDDGVPAADD